MNNSNDEYDLIQKIIQKKLTLEQIQEVDARIKEDENFAKNLALHISLHKAFNKKQTPEEIKGEREILDILQQGKKNKSKLRILYPYIAIASAILLLIVFTPIYPTVINRLDQFAENRSNQEELDKLVAMVEDKSTKLGGSSNLMDKNIEEGKFDQAIIEGERIRNNKEKVKDKCLNNDLNYKLGKLYLYYYKGIDKYTNAKEPLRCVYEYYPDTYKDVPIDLIKIYLNLGDKEEAQQIANTISTPLPPKLREILNN